MGSFLVKIAGLPPLLECERIEIVLLRSRAETGVRGEPKEVGGMTEHRVTVFSTPT